ncbi:MAG TPA: hypothetical protein VF450_02915 [Noviherbaspirillum sp.]
MNDKTENMQQNDFNHEECFDANVRPLIKQVHKLCEERHIPFIAAFAYGLDTTADDESKQQRFHMGGSCFLPGNDSVPPEMYLAHKLIFEGIDAAAPRMMALALACAAGDRQSHTEHPDQVPAGATIN